MAPRILAVLLILLAAGGYARTLNSATVPPSRFPELERLPARIDGWISREVTLTPEVQDVLRADAWVYRDYQRGDGAAVNVFVAYFSDQSVGSQIHSPRNCLPGSGWAVMGLEPDEVGEATACNRMTVERQGNRVDVLYWFRTRTGTVTGEYALKADLVRNAVSRRPTDAVFVRFMAPVRHDEPMRELIATLGPILDGILVEAGLP